MGWTYKEAIEIEKLVSEGKMSQVELEKYADNLLRCFVPNLYEYCQVDTGYSNKISARERLIGEGRAPIISTNPPMATGFVVDHVLFHLLKDSKIKRDIVYPPEMPGYMHFDVGKMKMERIEGEWW